MSEFWIPLTVAAALIQNGRTLWQRKLVGHVSVASTTYGRFFYGAPLTIAMMVAAAAFVGEPPPLPSATALIYILIGGMMQIVGNVLFISLLRVSNFAVMTTYAKMETVIASILSYWLLGDSLSPMGIAGIAMAFLGVMILAAARSDRSIGAFLVALVQRRAVLGVFVGALYAVGSTVYRAAAVSLAPANFLLVGVTVLAWTTVLQALLMGGYLLLFKPAALRETRHEWRRLVWVGVLGATASACWLSAFALQEVGYVLAVGQVELVFATLVAHLMLKERIHAVEGAGIVVTVTGILLAALGS